MRLTGKVAIVSGAASGNGGSHDAYVRARGRQVVIADVLEREGRQVADGIGAPARFEPLDVTE